VKKEAAVRISVEDRCRGRLVSVAELRNGGRKKGGPGRGGTAPSSLSRTRRKQSQEHTPVGKKEKKEGEEKKGDP